MSHCVGCEHSLCPGGYDADEVAEKVAEAVAVIQARAEKAEKAAAAELANARDYEEDCDDLTTENDALKAALEQARGALQDQISFCGLPDCVDCRRTAKAKSFLDAALEPRHPGEQAVVELSEEGIAQIIDAISRPGRYIPKLAALLARGTGRPPRPPPEPGKRCPECSDLYTDAGCGSLGHPVKPTPPKSTP